ncbi:MAG: helix-turn-helix domain-containing protein [Proteobacteria bacterium]|nr:helix-turn-helix domain-containing protein [Pseudomonadota bacterium]
MEALPNQSNEPPFVFSINESCRLLSISRRHFYGLLSEGKIKTVKIGARRLVSREEIERIALEGT